MTSSSSTASSILLSIGVFSTATNFNQSSTSRTHALRIPTTINSPEIEGQEAHFEPTSRTAALIILVSVFACGVSFEPFLEVVQKSRNRRTPVLLIVIGCIVDIHSSGNRKCREHPRITHYFYISFSVVLPALSTATDHTCAPQLLAP